MSLFEELEQELDCLKSKNNLRRLPATHHRGREVEADGNVMLNLSSNDYLGLATDADLRAGFLQTLTPDSFLPSASSSRLLTGNFDIYPAWRNGWPSFSGEKVRWSLAAAIT